MPWMECSVMSQRREFVELASKADSNVRGLCRRFGITARTGYKWLQRYRAEGVVGLLDACRRPNSSPTRTSDIVEGLVVRARREHGWCSRKLRGFLLRKGFVGIPSASTITAILHRHNLIKPHQPSSHTFISFEHPEPNDLWQMDFKGAYSTQCQRCHTLTILDDHSRYGVCLKACANETHTTVKESLIDIFRRYGLPLRINVDNGPPWGDGGEAKNTMLTLWMARLGVATSHSRPFHPQTNGKDERFHRTLDVEVLQGKTLRDIVHAQAAYDRWLPVYNFERPHDSLGLTDVPADRYRPSAREYPEQLPALEYDSSDSVRRVGSNGKISFRGHNYKISKAARGELVGIRPTNRDGIYKVYYARILLRVLDLKTHRSIRPHQPY